MNVAARFWTQPWTGWIASGLATGTILSAWAIVPPVARGLDLPHLGLALFLTGTLGLSRWFPIHIRHTTKVYMGTVPLYLMAVLLAPPIAALAAVAGSTITELADRSVKGSYYSDIAAQVARWGVVELCGSAVAHLPSHTGLAHLILAASAAIVLQVGDILTSPIAIVPITGERPVHVISECARGVGLPEAGQYFMGYVGVLLALYQIGAVTLVAVPLALLYRVSKRAKEMHESTRTLLENMADQVDARDPFTHEHSLRVKHWTRALLREMQVEGPEARLIVTAARVHDVGKIAIPDTVLHKEGHLTPEEWAMIQEHPAVGASMLSNYPAFARGVRIVRGHHERFDGQGYPDGIQGLDIPFGARVIAVADSYDAMTSDRPYRKGMPPERAVAILAAGKGTQWDPAVVDAFMRVFGREIQRPVDVIHGAHVLAGA